MDTSVWAHPQVGDALDDLIHNGTSVDIIESQIPGMFGVSRKATYLAFRALGLNVQQAAETMGLNEQDIVDWYETDREFCTWEAQNLHRLQVTLATELIRLGFMRNMALFIAKDANILGRSYDLDSLTRREFDYLKNVRKHYTPGDLLALEKVLNPNAHTEHVTINLSWGDAGGSSHHVIEGVKSEYQQLEAGDADSEPVFAG